MDYIDRQADEAGDEHSRALYAELRDRITRFEAGDPEFEVERMTLADAWLPSLVMLVIVVYFLVVVGLPS